MTSNESSSTASRSHRILSLDGGGAKGFYTLGILSEIESMAKQPLCGCFDLVFGTSTGAIIAALLSRGEKVSVIRNLYEQHVPAIMKQPSTKKRTNALHGVAYSVFKDNHCDVFKTGIGIVATNWKDESPIIFKTSIRQAYGLKDSFEPFFGISVADAVIGSCSAYPFFRRHTVVRNNGDIIELADGGFCANNPTLYAIADATQALRFPAESLRVLSIGVGSYPQPKLIRRVGRLVRNWALMRHVPGSDFLQKVLDTNTRSMEVLNGILSKDIATVRISEAFAEPEMATDLLEYDLKKLNRLIQRGRQSFAKREQEVRELLEC